MKEKFPVTHWQYWSWAEKMFGPHVPIDLLLLWRHSDAEELNEEFLNAE